MITKLKVYSDMKGKYIQIRNKEVLKDFEAGESFTIQAEGGLIIISKSEKN